MHTMFIQEADPPRSGSNCNCSLFNLLAAPDGWGLQLQSLSHVCLTVLLVTHREMINHNISIDK